MDRPISSRERWSAPLRQQRPSIRRVLSASGRYDDGTLALAITTADARNAVQTLREVRDRALESLARHELDLSTVHVTLAGYDHMNRRDPA